jgi:hypothetical protein
MATKTFYLLNTLAVTPDFFGNMQDGGSAPTAANCTYGFTPSNSPLSQAYNIAHLGANTFSTSKGAVAVSIANLTSPAKGTGSTNATSGDSFRVGPFNGVFAAGNWTFNWFVRPTTITATGRINMQVWKGLFSSGVNAVSLASILNGATVTLNSTTTSQNSTMTWNAPIVTLNNEYLFFQVEWQETTAGSNGSALAFRAGESSIVTTDFALPSPNKDSMFLVM